MSETQELYLGKKKYTVIGQRPIRHDGADKVTGKAASAKAAKRESKDGKNVITELKAEGDKSLGRYIYSYKRGILVRRHASRAIVTAQASSTGLASAHTSNVPLASWGTPVAGQ